MSSSFFTRGLIKLATGVVVVGLVIGHSVIGAVPAGADPPAKLVGVGAETTQDIMNAWSYYGIAPLASSSASGGVKIESWDATGSVCITPRAPGPTINRPNGDTSGRRALSRAIDGGIFGNASCGLKSVSGLVDFARSSTGPAAGDSGTALTYIPFGRDAISFAFYANGVASPVTALTRAQLATLYTTGPQTIASVNIIPCGVTSGTAAYSYWNMVTTTSVAAETAATTACVSAGNGQRLGENDGVGLKAKGDALVGSQVIVPYWSANFISRSNGVAPGPVPVGVGLGSISNNGSGVDLGSPYTGATPSLAPRASFYSDVTFGKDVYNVFDTGRVTGFGSNDLKSLFVGSGSVICQLTPPPCYMPAIPTLNLFGYLSIPNCGSTVLKGSLIAGAI